MNSKLHLAIKGVQSLKPYQAGKPISELEREYKVREAVKLASNENPIGAGQLALESATHALRHISRYPDSNGFSLKSALSRKLSVRPEQITLGNGSNEVLELVARAFVTTKHEVIFSQHAFAVYPLVTQAIGAQAVIVPSKNWGHDLDAMLGAITKKSRLIFIANPNNPTGTWLKKDELEAFIANVPDHVIVVIDEAYFEYVSFEEYPDASLWLEKYSNLVVTRTFSKIHGLAGLRIGYSLSHPHIADILNRVRQPFNSNSVALAAAESALSDDEHVSRSNEVNRIGMQQMIKGFDQLELEWIPSAGNFICVKVGDGDAVFDGLLHHGVITRPVSNYEMPEYLRITIGLERENRRFLTALEKILD